ELIAEQLISRARRVAKPAMNALPKNAFGLGAFRSVGEFGREFGLHGSGDRDSGLGTRDSGLGTRVFGGSVLGTRAWIGLGVLNIPSELRVPSSEYRAPSTEYRIPLLTDYTSLYNSAYILPRLNILFGSNAFLSST